MIPHFEIEQTEQELIHRENILCRRERAELCPGMPVESRDRKIKQGREAEKDGSDEKHLNGLPQRVSRRRFRRSPLEPPVEPVDSSLAPRESRFQFGGQLRRLAESP